MKQKLLKIFAIVGAGTVVMSAAAAPAKRIGVVEDPQVKIYALGATDANKGVYTLSATSDSPEKNQRLHIYSIFVYWVGWNIC